MVNKIRDNFLHLLFIIALPIMGGIYGLVNNVNNGYKTMITPLDNYIPFVKEFIVFYIIWFPFVLLGLVYICLKNRRVYYRTLSSIVIGMGISCIIFYVFQTYVPRPAVTGKDIFSQLVILIYSSDKPYNAFPSLHVLESYLIARGIHSLPEKRKSIVITADIIAVMIILSTQFVKQHVVIDIIGGLYLAEVIFNAVPGIKRILVSVYKESIKYPQKV